MFVLVSNDGRLAHQALGCTCTAFARWDGCPVSSGRASVRYLLASPLTVSLFFLYSTPPVHWMCRWTGESNLLFAFNKGLEVVVQGGRTMCHWCGRRPLDLRLGWPRVSLPPAYSSVPFPFAFACMYCFPSQSCTKRWQLAHISSALCWQICVLCHRSSLTLDILELLNFTWTALLANLRYYLL